MTEAEAIRFSESGWYKERSAEEIVALQLYEERLCVPEFGIFHEAMETALKRSVQTLEFGLAYNALRAEFESAVPDAQNLIHKMQTLKDEYASNVDHSKLLHHEQQIQKITEDYEGLGCYASSDFQCDQTGGFPTVLCVCFEKGAAWLELREDLAEDMEQSELDRYRQRCADYGIRSCHDNEQFNALLQELGEDAYSTAYLSDENESMQMGGL